MMRALPSPLRVVGPDELIARVNANSLDARARRLYPDSDYLQQEWIRAVHTVRRSVNGWLLERRVPRVAP